jgi:hypothetical protein
MNYQSRTLPLGTSVPDNFSPTLRSVICKHGRKFAYLRNSKGVRQLPYWLLETMVYGR